LLKNVELNAAASLKKTAAKVFGKTSDYSSKCGDLTLKCAMHACSACLQLHFERTVDDDGFHIDDDSKVVIFAWPIFKIF
jgi:hypothetical protein